VRFRQSSKNALYAVVACLEWARRISAGLWTMAVVHSFLRLKPRLQKRLRAFVDQVKENF
jgi:hypothetical protein